MPVPRDRLSLRAARRIALAAQGFGRPRPAGEPGARAVAGVVRRLGVVQIDSVNVLARAHYLPILARVGPYDRARLDDCSGRAPRSLFEYWGHEAALLPVGMHRLMRWRMDRVHDDAWGGMVRVQREQPDLVREVAEVVRATGPVTSTELDVVFSHIERGQREHWGWNWSAVKRALEYLFWAGEMTSAGRDSAFRRRYAAPEAVLPRAALTAPSPTLAEAHRELVAIAARALGVATGADLADYFRMATAPTREAIASSSAPASSSRSPCPTGRRAMPRRASPCPDGWRPRLSSPPSTRSSGSGPGPSACSGCATGSRSTPRAEQRVHGYYVLPFLLDEQLVARVDLKADRASGRLLVQAAHTAGRRPPGVRRGAGADAARDRRLAGPRRGARRPGRGPRRPAARRTSSRRLSPEAHARRRL